MSVVALGVHYGVRAQSNDGAVPPTAANAEVLRPAVHLQVRVGETSAQPESLLDPDAGGWKTTPRPAILLSHTPRIYQTEPAVDRAPPACQVQALRARALICLRLTWDDTTKNAPAIHHAQTGAGGAPRQPYRDPAPQTATFADAAAVMMPVRWTGPAFPSLMMGDADQPTRIFYWNASRGAAVLTATGRTTPQATGQQFPHQARYARGKWTLTMQLPETSDGYPVAFAVWDGQLNGRGGLKFFSVWYAWRQSAR